MGKYEKMMPKNSKKGSQKPHKIFQKTSKNVSKKTIEKQNWLGECATTRVEAARTSAAADTATVGSGFLVDFRRPCSASYARWPIGR